MILRCANTTMEYLLRTSLLRPTADSEGVPLVGCNFWDPHKDVVPRMEIEILWSPDNQVGHFGWKKDPWLNVRLTSPNSPVINSQSLRKNSRRITLLLGFHPGIHKLSTKLVVEGSLTCSRTKIRPGTMNHFQKLGAWNMRRSQKTM
jgi:hypothetical protein